MNFQTEYSWWFLPICLLVGATYAVLLYTKKDIAWNKTTNWILTSIRFVLVSIICVFLLGILWRQVQNQTEKPSIVLAIDNSQSVAMTTSDEKLQDLLKKMQILKEKLEKKDFEVQIQTIGQKNTENLAAIRFDANTTNLNFLLKNIENSYENRHLHSIVLVSDGIYNQDISPLYSGITIPIHTLAVGDTIPKADISLRTVFHNKIAYLGNKFPILAEIQQVGFAGKEVSVSLRQGDKIVDSKKLVLGKDYFPQEVSFLVEANQKGQQHFSVQVEALDKEFTKKNNTKEVYLEVLDNKEKILLLALSPHPDLKALKSAIEQNQNYEVVVHIPELSQTPYQNNQKYDLAILHQIPAFSAVGNDILKELKAKNTPLWFFVGSNTNLTTLNSQLTGIKIMAANQDDKITPSFNPTFDKFVFENEKRQFFQNYTPVTVPFGNYSLASNAEVLLYQQVGKIQTARPLLAFHEENGKKTAVFFGDGIWQWRLQEYALNENQVIFDEFIQKTVQLLASKDDKRRFRVNTSNAEFLESESVLFETQVYNTIYEKIYGQKIDLVLTDEKGKSINFSYTNTAENFKYKINGLLQGIYKYKATTQLDSKTETSTGEFTVKAVQLESLNTTADFGLLRELSKQSGGDFAKTIEELSEKLLQKEAQGIIRSQEITDELIHFKYLFFGLLLLASVEWFLRKFKGGY